MKVTFRGTRQFCAFLTHPQFFVADADSGVNTGAHGSETQSGGTCLPGPHIRGTLSGGTCSSGQPYDVGSSIFFRRGLKSRVESGAEAPHSTCGVRRFIAALS